MKKLLFLLLLSLFFTACEKDFEEINKNPYNPTSTSMEALFNGIVGSLQLGWNEQFYVHNEKLYEATQLGALTAHAWLNTAIGLDETWNRYYDALKNIRELESRFDAYPGDQAELNNVRAMLKVLLAYKTFYVTDQFGDIPFFDAGKGIQDIKYLRPKYDSQETIYKFLLDELEWAAENIEINPAATTPGGKPYYSFGAFDALFGSDMNKWRRFANSLRLRHAMRMVEKDRAFAEPIIADILTNQLPVVRKGEEVLLVPQKLGFDKLSTHWSFREHRNLRLGTTLWKMLSPNNKPDGSGIIDPRAYIFAETNNAGQWTPYPNVIPPGETVPVEGGVPYGGQRDINFDFKGASCVFSPFHYYLIRDENDVPEILLTAAEMHFLKAEAYKRGIGVPADDFQAEIEYNDGISASISFWYGVAQKCGIWQNAPAIDQTQIFQYIFNPAVSFGANGFKLEFIYAQQWLDMFRQPWEAWALARRTGKTPHEGEPLQYFRLVYPAGEAAYNGDNLQAQIGRMGGDRNDVKLWWMP
jgi:hypothetical protein